MNRKTIVMILALALVVICGVAGFFLMKSQPSGTVAVIYVDTNEYSRIDLSRVKEAYDIIIETRLGRNVIHVEQGAIAITEADCPDQICVHQGRLTGGGVPIICMPHHVVINIEGSGIDA